MDTSEAESTLRGRPFNSSSSPTPTIDNMSSSTELYAVAGKSILLHSSDFPKLKTELIQLLLIAVDCELTFLVLSTLFVHPRLSAIISHSVD
jgi:hypothetical protein